MASNPQTPLFSGVFWFVVIIPQGHSHVSLLIDMGFSAVAIAERMGHESIDITYRYAHLFPSVQAQMANRLNQVMEVDSNVSEKS